VGSVRVALGYGDILASRENWLKKSVGVQGKRRQVALAPNELFCGLARRLGLMRIGRSMACGDGDCEVGSSFGRGAIMITSMSMSMSE
jgi:hypothetical protein